ncbi:hypothetical protein AN217_10690 [Streptomyces qinglanensis]|uniref:Uncharacterized protein n=1 Tax=Streptomyces qinglanensis TaxID=943816 RepID=A0A1E7K2W1_9ACTN|nr:hypothetical protein [Streptomyces qinglanensis]OEU98215.1 hypothetical protein AN217_10690 [Streptomyces qinglanensis]OEV07278.1 hypothetical protein AN220_34665 [Streptomyces nanshensis]
MYSSDADLSVEDFLCLPFRTLSGGGFAAMVFLLARSADAPDLQRGFFQHWSDIDDLTGRCIAVFSPSPRKLQLSAEHPRLFYSPETIWVRGMAEAGGARSRLYLSSRESSAAVRMGRRQPGRATWQATGTEPSTTGPPRLVAAAAAVRPHDLEEHQRALTLTVSAMQRFFGIPGSLVPCAVFVDLEQRSASAVALKDATSVYDLLKRITTRIEHVLPRMDEAEAERVAALEARHRDRDLVGRLRSPAGNARAHWTAHKRRLIDDLQAFSARLAPPEADLCSWMARRLERDAPVADDEWTSVRSLLHVLAATEPHGRLPRRLRRTLAGMNSGRPEQDEAPRRLAVARAEAEATERRIGRAKARLDALGRELGLDAAVVGAAEDLGLVVLQEPRLHYPRGLDWPLKVLDEPAPHALNHGYERA